jgi:Tfp pilus assembly protein FimT
MLNWSHKEFNRDARMRGISLVEIVIVVALVLIIAGVAVPQVMQIIYNIRLRNAAVETADLMQQARITAARKNISPGLPVRFQTNNGTQQAYIDLKNDSTLDAGDPYIDLPTGITAASGAPNGTGGAPSAYTLVGDTSSGTPYDNTNVLAFSPRGLPCEYSSSTCSTPATTYFVFYFNDSRPSGYGWTAVLVTKSGRTRALFWNGTTWN